MLKTTHIFLVFLISLLQHTTCLEFSFIPKPTTFNSAISRKITYLSEGLGFCSNFFQYLTVDNFIIGKLTLPNMQLGDTVKLQFYHKDIELNITFNGSVLPDESSQETIIKLQNGQPITYRVDFPLSLKIPELENISINGGEFCGTTFNSTKGKLILQHTLQIINGSLSVFKYNINIPHFVKASTCGLDDTEITSGGLTPFIYGGTTVRRGEYPWLTAIYLKRKTAKTLICGGSLLTSEIILTAAHCFSISDLEVKNIEVYLGLYNLTNLNEESTVMREIAEVILHPEYKLILNFSDADLALVKMKNPVGFTHYIKPICLWSESADETVIVNHTGVVAGWGSDENNNKLSVVPKKVKTTIVSYTECLRSSPVYTALTTTRTFCAGRRDGSGPCEGDSGGGLMLNRNGRWMLRGVISAGLTNEKQCDLREYTVYCDVARHLPWLEHYIGNQEQPIIEPIEEICGKSGTESYNEYPWLAALYRRLDAGLIFHCTGTLISSRIVLFPAHCTDLPNWAAIPEDNFLIFLGRYDLNNIFEDGVVSREVQTYIRHPKYKFTVKLFYDNDLALFQMKTPVSFTQYIKPICLWNGPTDQSEVIGQSVTLLSWNLFRVFNESLTVPQSTEANIVPFSECKLDGYNAGTTTRFLCTPRFGNNVDGILMFKRNGRWLLRGVSTSNLFYIFRFASRNFRVYSDIVDHLQWIQSNIFL